MQHYKILLCPGLKQSLLTVHLCISEVMGVLRVVQPVRVAPWRTEPPPPPKRNSDRLPLPRSGPRPMLGTALCEVIDFTDITFKVCNSNFSIIDSDTHVAD